ncbi:MAG: hypothetical protein ABW201_03875 [Candidatus Thiodiazotropha sp.]
MNIHTLQILHHIHKVAPQVPVLVRTKDDTHLEELEAAGAAEVMPEAVEASLMMGGQLLLLLKVPGSRILKIMREIRENHYKLLRDFTMGRRPSISITKRAFRNACIPSPCPIVHLPSDIPLKTCTYGIGMSVSPRRVGAASGARAPRPACKQEMSWYWPEPRTIWNMQRVCCCMVFKAPPTPAACEETAARRESKASR